MKPEAPEREREGEPGRGAITPDQSPAAVTSRKKKKRSRGERTTRAAAGVDGALQERHTTGSIHDSPGQGQGRGEERPPPPPPPSPPPSSGTRGSRTLRPSYEPEWVAAAAAAAVAEVEWGRGGGC
ncbi:hypothetical protein STEG23_007187 [Scotinomys teguina]